MLRDQPRVHTGTSPYPRPIHTGIAPSTQGVGQQGKRQNLAVAADASDDDNSFVALAAAAQAAYVVTPDRDLIALQKPLGIQVVTPAQLIRTLRL